MIYQFLSDSPRFRRNTGTNLTQKCNEDLTNHRDQIMFLDRQLCRDRIPKVVSSTNGSIRAYDLNNRAHNIREEVDLVPFGHVMDQT